ncbi:uncharacterized protein N7459_009857 [Penicillium hispanicum]|uniref:uncharacterized protein n=1 Tax=Penicillium hispanicum TaxID=1080232 RepID=UPI0025415905|nr:uncharacterized protein N7459_009857 [Penicillium hispanicum]KAJ5570427.1 hypothetical protein N7459_009857 [Penicillium hispanicum]
MAAHTAQHVDLPEPDPGGRDDKWPAQSSRDPMRKTVEGERPGKKTCGPSFADYSNGFRASPSDVVVNIRCPSIRWEYIEAWSPGFCVDASLYAGFSIGRCCKTQEGAWMSRRGGIVGVGAHRGISPGRTPT